MSEADRTVIFRYRRRAKIKSIQRQFVPSFILLAIMPGIDAERRKDIPAFDQSYPEHIPNKINAHDDAVAFIKARMTGVLTQFELMPEFHAFGAPFVSIFFTSLR